MKNKYIILCLATIIAISFLTSCIAIPPLPPYYRYETARMILDASPYLQILLTDNDNVDSAKVQIGSAYGIYQYEPNRNKKFTGNQLSFQQYAMKTTGKVYSVNNQIIINKVNTRYNDIVLIPINNISMQAGKHYYKGYLRIKALPHNKVSIVNIIDMETYLPGVVSSEMSESWHENALAAQAITARTFAFYRIKQLATRKPSQTISDYDLTDDMYSQVYKGESRTGLRTRQAVENTRGIILSYNATVFNCMFHGICGGATESGALVFNLTPIAPLQGRSCGYCYNAKKFSWAAQFTEDEIIKALKLPNAKKIESIQAVKTAPGGHIVEVGVRITGRYEPIMFNAQRFRIALNPSKLRSTYFKIKRNGNVFNFTGRGWGHAVGMCQEGAKAMADQDFTSLQILEYYYPEAKVVKIY